MRNLFKITIFAAVLCCAGNAGFAWEWPDGYKLIDLGGLKAAIFNGTESKDGLYAIGWTLIPADKKSKPVDWSLWDKKNPDSENAWKFLDHYDWNDGDHPNAPYELVNCVVDLGHKKILELPTEFPGMAQSAHGYVEVSWGPAGKGRRYAIVQSEGRFYTANLWLVVIDPTGMRQIELAPLLAKQALQIVRDKRPRAHLPAYEEGVMLGERGTDKREISFHAQSADIPFDADVPKYGDDTSEVKGWITVRLPEATIEKSWSNTPLYDAFVNDPALAKADRELNQVYAALLQKLKPAARQDLKEEQRDWIRQRDNDATDAVLNADDTDEKPSVTRAKSLLKSTLERVAELKERLAGH